MRNETIERVLACGDAGSDGSVAIAPSTISAFRRLTDELRPLVGDLATKALYVRALHLARAGFQRPNRTDQNTLDVLFAALAQDLEAREVDDAHRAARALLYSMVDLLVSLIGEGLTYRMLKRAWSIPASDLPSKEEPLQ